MIVAASLAFMWGGVWRPWAGWLGVLVGILAIGSILFFTTFPFLLWVLVVSLLMFLRPALYAGRTGAPGP
jgi:predicted lipid-binding transport protein (Tim44 family)